MPLSAKQRVYQEMFHQTLPYLRNAANQSWWRKLRDRSAAFESELIHNLPVSMFLPEFDAHDIWFLNVQAKTYYEQCAPSLSYLYPLQVERLKRLFALVPDELAKNLKWRGPQ